MSDLLPVTVVVVVHASAERAWEAFTNPTSILQWNFASADWHCPQAQNDLRDGGAFSYRMEARDGSFGFDFEGAFLEVTPPTRLRYSLGPEREVLVEFAPEGEQTRVSQTFTPEATHPVEQQRAGWQAILDNFKAHVESAARES
jgi:uncharacterized protein YndB with AHSA1/START domain